MVAAPPRTFRRAFALVDVIVATIILGASLAVILGLSARAVSAQKRGEEIADAARLADEQLQLVLARGPDNYARRFSTSGACDAPFERFRFALAFSGGTGSDPYRVNATISWVSGALPQSISVDTLVAPREANADGDPDPIRKPDSPIVRTQ